MKVEEAINERHSVRRFSSKKPNYREIIEAVDAANKTPLAGNICTLRFIVVSDKEKIKELAEASQQDFISQASYIVVVCSSNKEIERFYDERGLMYSRQQAGAAIENFLLRITELGLASCWIGAFSDSSVKNILSIPDNIEVEALLPVGYEFGKTKQRKKPKLDAVLFFDKYGNKFMKPERKPYV